MAHHSQPVLSLPEFRNEPYTDFKQPENRKRMEEALAKVRGQLGREYDIVIGGERVRTAEKLKSVNPARPASGLCSDSTATSRTATCGPPPSIARTASPSTAPPRCPTASSSASATWGSRAPPIPGR